MAYINYDKLRRSEFDKIVSAKDREQDIIFNQLKIKVHDTFKKDEKITTSFEPSSDHNFVNKAYLEIKLSKTEGPLSLKGEKYTEFLLPNEKQSKEVSIQRVVRTTVQILFDKAFFD